MLIALGAVLRFATLGQQSLWFDEAVTYLIVSHSSLAHAWTSSLSSEAAPPFYYVLEWALVHVAGTGAAGLRFLSAIAGIGMVPVGYLIGSELQSRRLGLGIGALAATSPLLVWYSQEARAYSLLGLLSALSFLWFLKARRHPKARTLFGWAILSALALCTQYLAAILIVPQAIYLLLTSDFWVSALASFGVGVTGLALLPLALSQAHNPAWIGSCCFALRSSQIPKQLLAGLDPPVLAVVATAAIAVLGFGFAVRRRDARLCLALAVVAVFVLFVMAAVGKDYFLTRNLLPVWLPLAAAMAIGLTDLRGGTIALGALCAIGIAMVLLVAIDPRSQKPDMHSTVASLGPPQPRALVVQGVFDAPVRAYQPQLHPNPQGGSVYEVDVISTEGPYTNPACWWGARCYFPMYQAQALQLPAGLHLVSSRRFDNLQVVRLRSDRPVHLGPANVGNNYLLFE